MVAWSVCFSSFSNADVSTKPISYEIEAAAGFLDFDYTEYSSKAPNGVLDTEKGRLTTGSVLGRYQSTASKIPWLMQVRYEGATGDTNYDGYLQQGTLLSPFNAKTGNEFDEIDVRFGLPFHHRHVGKLMPFMETGWHEWRRRLVSYEEVYQHQVVRLGLSGDWRASSHWQTNAEISLGKLRNSQVIINSLGVVLPLQDKQQWRASVGLLYHVNPQWVLGAGWQFERFEYGRSSVIRGVFEPDSRSEIFRSSLLMSYTF